MAHPASLALIPLLGLLGTLAPYPCSAAGASAKEIDIKVNAALERFDREVGGAKEFMRAAKGVLILPDVIQAGFVFGAQYGEGALRIGGRTVDYYGIAGASVGFQIGAQSKIVMLVFMDNAALDRFRRGRGWQAGVDGSIAVIDLGVGGRIDTNNMRDPIVGFVFGNKGLMADVSFEGSKFTRLDKGR